MSALKPAQSAVGTHRKGPMRMEKWLPEWTDQAEIRFKIHLQFNSKNSSIMWDASLFFFSNRFYRQKKSWSLKQLHDYGIFMGSHHSRLQSFARPSPRIAKGDEKLSDTLIDSPLGQRRYQSQKMIIFNQLHVVNHSWSGVSQEKYIFNHPD